MPDIAAQVLALPDECDACRAKPGAPTLCSMCLEVRALKGVIGERLRAFNAVVEAAKGLCEAVDGVAVTGALQIDHPIFMKLLGLSKSLNALNRVFGDPPR